MIQLLGSIFIILSIILIIIIKCEIKIKEIEEIKLLYNNEKKNEEKEKFEEKEKENNIYKNVLTDYIKNTSDISILNDEINQDIETETAFINPNLSIKEARSNFTIEPLNLNNNNENIRERFENKVLKKIK